MCKLQFQLRIFLVAFALGLASTSFFNNLDRKSDEMPVNLAQIQSDTIIYLNLSSNKIFTKTDCFAHMCYDTQFVEIEWKHK